MTAAVLATVSVVALLVLLRLRRRIAVVTVDGPSMAPAYRTGDRVLVVRRVIGRIRTGEVVVLQRPDADNTWPVRPTGWMIKRVVARPGDFVPVELRPDPGARVPAGMLVLLGDNPDHSYDSRHIGFVPASRLLGVVARAFPRRVPARSDSPAGRVEIGQPGVHLDRRRRS